MKSASSEIAPHAFDHSSLARAAGRIIGQLEFVPVPAHQLLVI
jgi:hypothetical protein